MVQDATQVGDHEGDEAKRQAEAEERYAAYIEQFEPDTLNDEQTLRELVSIEIQLELARVKLTALLVDPKASHTKAKALSDIKSRLLADYKRCQDELGISRAKRASQKDVREELPRVIRAASDFLHEHAIQIRCPHCLDEPAEVNINQGFILFHFRQDVKWKWEQDCPRCGMAFTILPVIQHESQPPIPAGQIAALPPPPEKQGAHDQGNSPDQARS